MSYCVGCTLESSRSSGSGLKLCKSTQDITAVYETFGTRAKTYLVLLNFV